MILQDNQTCKVKDRNSGIKEDEIMARVADTMPWNTQKKVRGIGGVVHTLHGLNRNDSPILWRPRIFTGG